MSSLADAPDLVGFFSYSREDDEDSGGRLSKLRERIQAELRGQLGRTKTDFRLWQDKTAIAHGKLWENEIKSAIAESVFFIPIITPTAVRSNNCKFEFDSFLAREKELGRNDLVFPILYIPVPALADDRWRDDPLLAIIGSRQYEQWQHLRHFGALTPEVALRVEKFCANICRALHEPRLSLERERTQVPSAAQLPNSLKELSSRNAINVRHASFNDDVEQQSSKSDQVLPFQSVAPVEVRDLQAVIGHVYESGEVQALIERLGEASRPFKHRDCYIHSVELAGVSLRFERFDTDRRLTTVLLYGDGTDGFSQYNGRLPKGLSFSDVRSQVERKCGPPLEFGGSASDYIKYWARYEDFTVVYESSSLNDMNNKIHHIKIHPVAVGQLRPGRQR
jgi:TIR domain